MTLEAQNGQNGYWAPSEPTHEKLYVNSGAGDTNNLTIIDVKTLTIIKKMTTRRACRATWPNTGPGGQRPNRIGDGKLDDSTIAAWFDKTALVVPPDFTFGNSGRSILRGDHQWNVDFSLFKRFSVRGSSALEFRAEAFNLLNSVYFSNPNTAIDTTAGGRVTSTSNAARQLQFGLKYLF